MRNFAALTAICLSISILGQTTLPTFARGFGGGGFGGFHGGGGGGFGGFHGGEGGFGGFRGGGGFDRGGGGFDRSFGGEGGGFKGFGGDHDGGFGGGFNNISKGGDGFGKSGFGDSGFGRDAGFNKGDFGNFTNKPNLGGGGIGNKPGFGGGDHSWNNPGNKNWGNENGHFPTDGGFGHESNWKNGNFNNNNHYKNWNQTNNTFNNNSVRNSFNSYNVNNFNHWGGYGGYGYHGYGYGYGYGHGAWWGYPGGWYCPGWSSAMAWTYMGVSSLTSFLGIAALAGSMGGGGGGGGGSSTTNTNSNNGPSSVTNITYEGDNVYVDGKPQGTAVDYYNQASQLATQGSQNTSADSTDGSGEATDAGDWKPLGVFSLAQPGQTESSMLFQIAINKDGVVRGNYFNQLTNETSTIYGQLDKKTQRISFTLGQNNKTVFDTSLTDITKADAPVLVHYGPTNTQPMMLVRLDQPKADMSKTTG